MENVWDENGNVTPVTRINAGPVIVTQIKTKDIDGYESFQVGFDNSAKKLSKPLKGHLKDIGNFRYLHEFVKKDNSAYKIGDAIDVSVFNSNDLVRVTGIGKGRGFQGVVKRHGFSGGPKTHGDKDQQRTSGSIGSTGPQRVMPGKKMAGHMGCNKVTVKNLRIISVDKENNFLLVKGAVPGNKKGIIFIETI